MHIFFCLLLLFSCFLQVEASKKHPAPSTNKFWGSVLNVERAAQGSLMFYDENLQKPLFQNAACSVKESLCKKLARCNVGELCKIKRDALQRGDLVKFFIAARLIEERRAQLRGANELHLNLRTWNNGESPAKNLSLDTNDLTYVGLNHNKGLFSKD